MSDESVNAALKQISAAVEGVGRTLHEQEGRLRQEIAGLRQEMHDNTDRLHQEIIEVRTGVMKRMDRLQDGLTCIRDDIAVTQATAETARDRDEGTRKELRSLGEIVSVMHRQIQRLQTQMRELRGDP